MEQDNDVKNGVRLDEYTALNQWPWIINRGLEVDGPRLFLDWVLRKEETQLSLTPVSAVNIQPSHSDRRTSMGTGETVPMDGTIRIPRHEQYEVNEMTGDVYVGGLYDVTWISLFREADASAFEESGCLMLRGGDGYEYDEQVVGRRDEVIG